MCTPYRHENHPSANGECFVSLLPASVVVECIGKNWVMWPERRILVEFNQEISAVPTTTKKDDREDYDGCAGRIHRIDKEEEDDEVECMFFTVGATLGVVNGPVMVSMDFGCIGWLGGTMFMTIEDAPRRKGSDLDRFVLRGHIGCCNQKWVVLSTSEDKLFAMRLATGERHDVPIPLELQEESTLTLVSLRFFGTTEYDFESDVVEALYLDQPHALFVVHFNLLSAMGDKQKLVGFCDLPDMRINYLSIINPLIRRSDSTYCFTVERKKCVDLVDLKANIVTLDLHWDELGVPDKNGGFTIGAVDEQHLCLTNKRTSVTTIYHVSELLHMLESDEERLRQQTSCRVHLSAPGSIISAGCGILISSSILGGEVPDSLTCATTSHPYYFSRNPRYLQLAFEHQIIDAATDTILFKVQRAPPRLPYEIKAVPFTTPLPNELNE
ncbi:hypothetical protein Pelo_11405 [Pelomyxa schiedti]|nr:hypothetical protein Pelo_11405 [Pelomyxa schiedti]